MLGRGDSGRLARQPEQRTDRDPQPDRGRPVLPAGALLVERATCALRSQDPAFLKGIPQPTGSGADRPGYRMPCARSMPYAVWGRATLSATDQVSADTAIGDQKGDPALINRWIEPNPHKRRVDEAWLVECAVPVWAIVGHWRAVGGDVWQVADDYEVPTEAVEAALAYYRRHRALIDARIEANALP